MSFFCKWNLYIPTFFINLLAQQSQQQGQTSSLRVSKITPVYDTVMCYYLVPILGGVCKCSCLFLSMLQCNTMQYKFPAEVEISCVSHRYTAVAMPMLYNTRYSSRRRVTVMISVVWVLSFAISCPLLFGLNNTGKKKAAVSHLFFFVWLECVLNCQPPCLRNCLLTFALILHRTTSFHP